MVNKRYCTLCGKKQAFFYRRYSGQYLCRGCFIKSIEKKVRATISKQKMFEINDRIAVSVSGGKDSVSLLHVLVTIEKSFPKSSIYAITIDEGIEGYRDEALEIVSENCSKLGIKYYSTSFKELYGYTLGEILKKINHPKKTACTYCGILRRRAINILARKTGADKIATAHNLDDEIQTFIQNIMRGDTVRIGRLYKQDLNYKTQFLKRVKPFCEILEKESALFAYIKGISFQEMPCPYGGEAMRNDVRNTINRLEEKHPGLKFSMFSSMRIIQRAVGENMKNITLNDCITCGEPTSLKICQVCKIFEETN